MYNSGTILKFVSTLNRSCLVHHRFKEVCLLSCSDVLPGKRRLAAGNIKRNPALFPPCVLSTTSPKLKRSVLVSQQRFSVNAKTSPHEDSTPGIKCPVEPHGTDVSRKPNNVVTEKPEDIKPYSAIPGPRGLYRVPLLGAALLFKPFSKYTFFELNEIIQNFHNKYGPIFRIRLGKEYAVFVEDIDGIETMFRSEGQYPKRSPPEIDNLYRDRNNLPYTIIGREGEDWLKMRSVFNSLSNNTKVVRSYLPAQNHVADDFVELIQKDLSPEEQIEVFFRYALESVGVVGVNARLGFLTGDLQDSSSDAAIMYKASTTIINAIATAALGAEYRFKTDENDPFYKNYEQANLTVKDYIGKRIEPVIEQIREMKERETKQGLSDEEREFVSSNILASVIYSHRLPLPVIITMVEGLIAAGSESTARTLNILFYDLATNPEIQTKLAEEIHSLLGKEGSLTAEALDNMAYVKACVKESMRLHSPLPFGTDRWIPHETVICGYRIPAGAHVASSNTQASMNPKYCRDPHVFRPERWLRSNMSERPPPFMSLPFGFGPRSCVGRRFAENEIYVGLVKLIQSLEISIDPDFEFSIEYRPFIITKKPIPFRFRKRSA